MAGRTAAGQGFATFSNLEMQHSPKIFCIFLQKVLAKNTDNHSGIKCVIHFPADNTTAIPVDHGCQIQKSALDRDICNVNRPCLIWLVYDRITKKIWTYFRLLHSLGKIHLWINRVNIHLIHVASCLAATNMITTGFQLCRHLSCTPCRIVSMPVDMLKGQPVVVIRNQEHLLQKQM